MTARSKITAPKMLLAVVIFALILQVDNDSVMPSKDRLLYSVVYPLAYALGAIAILVGTAIIAIRFWPTLKNKTDDKALVSKARLAPVSTETPSVSTARTLANEPRRQNLLAEAPESTAPEGAKVNELAQQMIGAMYAEKLRLDALREARANEKTPLPGIGEARYHPIVFAQHLPPKMSKWLSYYGGRPTVPPGFIWPVSAHDADRPLHFLMQWDCRHLAPQDATGLLPNDGVLFCFIDYIDNSPFDARIIYAPGPTDDWLEAEVPASLGPVTRAGGFPYCTDRVQNWQEQLPSLFPRWTFEPVAIDYPRSYSGQADADDSESGDWFWNETDSVGEELLKAQEKTIGLAESDDHQYSSIWGRPFETFPHDWAAVRILSAIVLDSSFSDYKIKYGNFPPDMDQDAKDQTIMQWREQAEELFHFAAQYALADSVPQGLADDIWAWCETVRPAIELGFQGTVTESVNASLGLGSAALDTIPGEFIKRTASCHALALSYMREEYQRETSYSHEVYEQKKARGELKQVRQLDALSPNRIFGPPSYVQGYVEEYVLDHILLLEMSTAGGTGFNVGDGVIHILITPDDLRERRFDKVEVVSSSY